MGVALKTLASGVLALVGLLIIIALFVTQPSWIIPVMVFASAVNLAIIAVVAAR